VKSNDEAWLTFPFRFTLLRLLANGERFKGSLFHLWCGQIPPEIFHRRAAKYGYTLRTIQSTEFCRTISAAAKERFIVLTASGLEKSTGERRQPWKATLTEKGKRRLAELQNCRIVHCLGGYQIERKA